MICSRHKLSLVQGNMSVCFRSKYLSTIKTISHCKEIEEKVFQNCFHLLNIFAGEHIGMRHLSIVTEFVYMSVGVSLCSTGTL